MGDNTSDNQYCLLDFFFLIRSLIISLSVAAVIPKQIVLFSKRQTKNICYIYSHMIKNILIDRQHRDINFNMQI